MLGFFACGSHYGVAAQSSKILSNALNNAPVIAAWQSMLEKEIQVDHGEVGKDLFKQSVESMRKLDPWAMFDYCDGVIVIKHEKKISTPTVASAVSTPHQGCVLVTSSKSTPGETILEFMNIKGFFGIISASGIQYRPFISSPF